MNIFYVVILLLFFLAILLRIRRKSIKLLQKNVVKENELLTSQLIQIHNKYVRLYTIFVCYVTFRLVSMLVWGVYLYGGFITLSADWFDICHLLCVSC
jgi:hypothetical protein